MGLGYTAGRKITGMCSLQMSEGDGGNGQREIQLEKGRKKQV